MAILNAWQRVDRVISGSVWGDGKDGAATLSSTPCINTTFTGTAGSTSGTAGATTFANGDLVMIIESQNGTVATVGNWEINMVKSGGGTTSLVLKTALHYTYAADAQIVRIPRYTTVTINGYSIAGWNGTNGGIEVICARRSITVSGKIVADGLGYAGGASGNDDGAKSGEGRKQTNDIASNGAGQQSHAQAGGGGGGALSGGSVGASTGGSAIQVSDLTSLLFGGGGGGGASNSSSSNGGAGGGIVVLISENVVTTANGASVTGSNSNGGIERSGGGGAGGSLLICCNSASLGTNKNVATGGIGGASTVTGATGSVGTITVHHSGTVTGTTNPTFNDIVDTSFIQSSGSFFGLI